MDQPGSRVTAEILFLVHRPPFPPDRGDRIRSWHLVEAMTRIAPVHVMAPADPAQPVEQLAPLRAVCASLTLATDLPSRSLAMARALASGRPASVEAFRSPSLLRAAGRLLAERPIKAIYAYSGQSAQYVPETRRARFVMDFVDVDSAKFEAMAKGLARPAYAFEAARLRRFERAVARRADLSVFVSEAEAALFRQRIGNDRATVGAIENGVDLSHFAPDASFQRVTVPGAPVIVFTGQMDYAPNVEAVMGFARDCLPAVRTIFPEAVFAIVGRSPVPAVRRLEQFPGIVVTGEVADTRGWIAAAGVVVAPLRLARGVQNKVLEAMAMGRPVVASAAAAQGIDAVAGRDLLVGDGAGPVLSLLRDPARAAAIGAAARARLVARYGWERQLAGLPSILGFDS